jgi:hypothetical protein
VLDERDVVSRMQRGDQRAFNEFFETYAPRLISFAVRRSSLDPVAIEDVVQMTMINAMRNSVRTGRRGVIHLVVHDLPQPDHRRVPQCRPTSQCAKSRCSDR